MHLTTSRHISRTTAIHTILSTNLVPHFVFSQSQSDNCTHGSPAPHVQPITLPVNRQPAIQASPTQPLKVVMPSPGKDDLFSGQTSVSTPVSKKPRMDCNDF